MDCGKQKLMDKGRISKFNKNFKILNQKKKLNVKCIVNANGYAVWLVENTTLTFKQIADFVNSMRLRFKVLQMAKL